MIIGTTSMKSILQEMEVVDCFNVCQSVPCVRLKKEINAVLSQFTGGKNEEESRRIADELVQGSEDGAIRGAGIPIKNLILSIELAIESNSKGRLEFESFMDAFNSVNHY